MWKKTADGAAPEAKDPKWKRFLKHSSVVPYLLLFAVYLVYFIGVNKVFGDDEVFRRILSTTTPVQMALDYRETWSARILIELVTFHLYSLPVIVWKLLNALVMVLMAYSIARLGGVQNDRRGAFLACGAVCVYPMIDMIQSAGWITTSCNYLVPLALAIYAMGAWVDRLFGRPVRWYSYVLGCLALVYAANAEQVLAILVGFTLVALFCAVKNRVKLPIPYVATWILILAGMGVQRLFAPGVALRQAQETAQFNPDPNPLKRLVSTFSDMSWHMIVGGAFLTLLLASFVVCVAVFARHKGRWQRGVALVPLVVCALFGVLYPAAVLVMPGLRYLKENLIVDGVVFTSESFRIVPYLLYLAVWGCLLAGVYLAAPTREKGRFWGVVFLAGFCSQLIMFLVPSAPVSVQRYSIYMHFALLIVAFLCAVELQRDQPGRVAGLARGAIAAAGAGALLNLYIS